VDVAQLISDPVGWYHSHELLVGSLGVNALLAISLWVTLYAGQLALANVGFMAIGAYTSVIMANDLGTPFVVNLLAGGALAAAVAAVIGFPVLRLRGVYLAIATIGFAEMLRFGVILNLPITGEAQGLSNLSASPSGGILPVWVFVAVLVLAFSRLRTSKPMEAWAAMREDELAAASNGVNVPVYRLACFVLGAVIAGAAGALDSHLNFFVDPTSYSFSREVLILIMVILGGILTPYGPLIGAAVITLLPEVFRFAADYRSVVYGLLFMLMIVFRPTGLLRPIPPRGVAWPWLRRKPRPTAAEAAP
jgi:branched-chain amino acid transport system permease protein